MIKQFIINVAETSRIDGSLDGGFSIYCKDEEEVQSAIAELEAEIAHEVLTDDYPFNSLRWIVNSYQI